MTESHARSILKGISWRVIGTIDTIVISFLFTGHLGKAFKIGISEVFTKIILYYFHERIWLYFIKDRTHLHWVSFTKGVTWRVIGSIDTTMLAWFWTGSGQTGLQIGSVEVLTKIILFYFHERLWVRIPIGTIRKYIPYFDKKEGE
ncbi:MAG: DUF2061 domain-containing protein [Chitinophagales bacterium]|nr:DUF2061 domain-containing protein [Chitinophagales bacterium]